MKGYSSFVFLILLTVACCSRRETNRCARERKIPCDDGQCIGRWDWCDGKHDCTDKSDEKYCKRKPVFGSVPNNHCTHKHFVCKDGMCIPASLRCDREHDCYDHTDENDCDSLDSDRPISSTSEELDSTTTKATEPYTPIPTSFYDRRLNESNSYGGPSPQIHYYHPPPQTYHSRPPPQPDNYRHPTPLGPPPPVYHNLDNNNDHGSQHNPHRGSDTFPRGGIPFDQTTTETSSQTWSYRSRTTQDPSEPNYLHVDRRTAIVNPPRSVLYPPYTKSSSSSRPNVRKPPFSPFFFSKNYTEDFQYDYERTIRKAKAWILSQRDDSYSWDRDTPRALIALSLISNSFQSDEDDNELMKKSLQTHLGIKILRNDTGLERMSTTRLAMYINSLLATCQDPRDFLGLDLPEILDRMQNRLEKHQRFINPLIFLSLCLTDMPLNVNYFQAFLLNSFPSEISKDLHILATAAMACASQQNPQDNYLKAKSDEAARSLLEQMNPEDGSFGSKYSTALAAQALMSVNMSHYWNPKKTLKYLAKQQLEDGSFGDMQSTYYTVLALSGRSLLHLRNTVCDSVDDKKEWSPEDILGLPGPKKNILYTLRYGYPETFSAGMQLSVPAQTNFFDIMRVAAHQDPRFKFEYEITNKQLSVHTIANVPSDPERGTFWNLYKLSSSTRSIDLSRRYKSDIRTLIPDDGDELLFWYLKDTHIFKSIDNI